LSLRGKAEFEAIKASFTRDSNGALVEEKEESPDGAVGYIRAIHNLNLKSWVESQSKPIDVPPSPYKDAKALAESIQRGQQLFSGNITGDNPKLKEMAAAAKCVTCHNDYGRQSQFRWDDWATLARPQNFTAGVFRGGR